MLDRTAYLSVLRRDTAAFADVLHDGDLETPVPDCPGWTLADLGNHLGGVHEWASGIITTGVPDERPIAPVGDAGLAHWYAERAEELIAALSTTDPATEVWTFGPSPRTVSFWLRRQPLETAVHLHDARRAVGLASPIDQELAADGVDEVVTIMFPRQVRLERIAPLGRGVRLVLADVPDTAYVLAGDGTAVDGSPVATVTATAEQLLLALWRRLSVDTLTLEGDADAAREVFRTALTP